MNSTSKNLTPDQYKDLLTGSFEVSEEYRHAYNTWVEYFKATPDGCSKSCFRKAYDARKVKLTGVSKDISLNAKRQAIIDLEG